MNIDHAEELVTLLERTFISASQHSMIPLWEESRFLQAIRNIAQERPTFTDQFVCYATSPLPAKFLLKKAIAAYLALEGARPDSSREIEALSLFTDNLFSLTDYNTLRGLSNRQPHNLFVSAGKLHLSNDEKAVEHYSFRRNELVKIWPTVIKRCAGNETATALSLAGYGVSVCDGISDSKGKMIDIALESANKIIDTQSKDPNTLVSVVNELSSVSSHMEDYPSKIQELKEIWFEGIDAIYQLSDPKRPVGALAVSLARGLLRSPTRMAPEIRNAARHVVENYRVLVEPAKGEAVMAHLGLLIPEATYH